MIRSTLLRRLLLGMTAVFYLGVAAVALVRPLLLAEQLGFVLDEPLGLNEFRAIYLGLWAGQAMLAGLAARHPVRHMTLGDVIAALMLALAAGRLISLALDGWAGVDFLPVLVSEVIGGIAILLIRPTPD